MFNTVITILLVVNFIVITLLFWFLTFLELLFNKSTDNKIKNDVYECGFNTVNKTTFPVTLNTVVLLLFVIIYEIEFILLIPVFLSLNITLSWVLYNVLFIFWFIIITLYFDILLKKIYWVY